MQLSNARIAAALAVVAVAGSVPLIGNRSDEAVAATSTAPAWAIQPGGTLEFAARNGSDTIGAKFAKWGGTINFDPDSPGAAAIHIDVDLTSASIGDSFKDELLQGDEFFGSASTPTATAVVVVGDQRVVAGPARTRASTNDPVRLMPRVAQGKERTPTATPIL